MCFAAAVSWTITARFTWRPRRTSCWTNWRAHLNEGAGADAVRPALLKALTRLRAITSRADDSGGVLGDACQRAANLYARSCREGRPDPSKVARWLVKFRAESPGWPNTVLADFVAAFDDRALAVYRHGVNALDAALRDEDRWKRFEVNRMLLELADHDGDVDQALELLTAGEHPAFGAIVDRLLAAGRRVEAMRFVDRAVADHRLATHTPANDYFLAGERVARLYVEHGRPQDAVAALRTVFEAAPGPATFDLLGRFADEIGDGEAERAWARSVVADRAARHRSGAVMVELALHEADLDRAWAAADRYGAGGQWEALAAAARDTQPRRVLDLYRDQVQETLQQATAKAYHRVAALLARDADAGRRRRPDRRRRPGHPPDPRRIPPPPHLHHHPGPSRPPHLGPKIAG